jgi:AraC-like DNA-binding protein
MPNGPAGASGNATLPLVRLSLIFPVIATLERRGIDSDQVLRGSGLTRDAVETPETFVHAMVIHQFLENAAAAAEDPHLLVGIGEALDTTSWPPLIEAAREAETVGSFITLFIAKATDHASSAVQQLAIDGPVATLSERRTFKPSITPAQNDAFGAGLWVALLRRSVGDSWDSREVMVTVSDPTVLPPVFYGIQALKGDTLGYRIRFPSVWLNKPFDKPSFLERSSGEVGGKTPAATLVEAVRQTLMPHIGDADLTVERAAKLCRIKRRALARMLAEQGATLVAVINDLKCEAATEALASSDQSIAKIATSIGFTDPTSFTRSFKRWTGQSPRAYREAHQIKPAQQ